MIINDFRRQINHIISEQQFLLKTSLQRSLLPHKTSGFMAHQALSWSLIDTFITDQSSVWRPLNLKFALINHVTFDEIISIWVDAPCSIGLVDLKWKLTCINHFQILIIKSLSFLLSLFQMPQNNCAHNGYTYQNNRPNWY